MMLTFISLFAGIGGMDLGLERAGMRCVAQVEIDDYATRVLAKHWPDVPRFRDVRDVGAHNLPAADLICGGFPCQDISFAGWGKGLKGERSGLWYEYARIISELRPQYVLVENVTALLHRGLSEVLSTLSEIGYDAEWECIPAASIGAPHIRDRVFLLAYPTGDGRDVLRRKAFTDEPGDSPYMGWTKKKWGARGQDFTLASRHCIQRLWSPQPGVQRVLDGVPYRMDRLRGLGNAVVPQVAEYIGRRIVATEETL